MQLRMAVLILAIGAGACQAASWTKYVAPDGSYSFHYPTGWEVKSQGSTAQVDNAATGEQLLLLASGAGKNKTARAVAQTFVVALQKDVPDLTVTQWNDLKEGGKLVLASITYSQDKKRFTGDMLVLIVKNAALWFAYSAPEGDYTRLRSKAVLGGFAGSFASNDGSKCPEGEIPDLDTGRLDRDAGAFIFALEFGCGTVFSQAQEQTLRDETLKEWRDLPPGDQAKFDAYPGLMQTILGLKQSDLVKVQAKMKQLTEDALAKATDSPATQVLRDAIAGANKAVVEGTPPLTASAADAYAELMAFVHVSAQKADAGPEDISADTVKQIRGQLVQGWPKLTSADRQTALGAPGLWLTMRMILQQGTADQKRQVRDQIKQFAASSATVASSSGSGGAASSSGGSSGKPMDWGTFNLLQSMKQTTFNTYMWSRGFSGWTPMGKTW